MREVVVCVHGIWMKGVVMKPISRYLAQRGHQCLEFSYKSVRRSPAENAKYLAQFVERIDAEIIHFVGHSLGGIVLLHYFQMFEAYKPGRVVMLGSPVAGSAVARFISKSKFIKNNMLGESAKSLLGEIPAWNGNRSLAIIAGTHGTGIGKIMGAPLDQPNDGTVAVSETQLANCNLHVCVPYSHTGMLLAKPVAHAIDEYLRTGSIS